MTSNSLDVVPFAIREKKKKSSPCLFSVHRPYDDAQMTPDIQLLVGVGMVIRY